MEALPLDDFMTYLNLTQTTDENLNHGQPTMCSQFGFEEIVKTLLKPYLFFVDLKTILRIFSNPFDMLLEICSSNQV